MRVIVIGGNSYLGKKVTKCLNENEIESYGTYNTNPIHSKPNIKLDVTRTADIYKVIKKSSQIGFYIYQHYQRSKTVSQINLER